MLCFSPVGTGRFCYGSAGSSCFSLLCPDRNVRTPAGKILAVPFRGLPRRPLPQGAPSSARVTKTKIRGTLPAGPRQLTQYRTIQKLFPWCVLCRPPCPSWSKKLSVRRWKKLDVKKSFASLCVVLRVLGG